MKIFKFLILAVLLTSLIGSVSAQTKKRKSVKRSSSKIAGKSDQSLKILAEGTSSPVENPRILIARTAKDYLELQSLVEHLPAAAEIDFKKTAVVAAFAGTKNTGGYSVSIRRVAGVIKAEVVTPPKDAMTADVLTQPFAVALVPISTLSRIEYSNDWKVAQKK